VQSESREPKEFWLELSKRVNPGKLIPGKVSRDLQRKPKRERVSENGILREPKWWQGSTERYIYTP